MTDLRTFGYDDATVMRMTKTQRVPWLQPVSGGPAGLACSAGKKDAPGLCCPFSPISENNGIFSRE